MSQFNKVLKHLNIVSPFIGPWEIERRRGRAYRARLGANENLFGMSPEALTVAQEKLTEQRLYCDPIHRELRDSIAADWGQPASRIVIAEGIEGLLALFARAFLDHGDKVVRVQGSYPSIDYYAKGLGAEICYISYNEDFTIDVNALVALASEQNAKMIYLANPDNPTGLPLKLEEVETLIRRLPADCLLLLDEAYADFIDESRCLRHDFHQANVVRLRTFSKLYGLAGSRIGYAIADESIVQALDRIRQHFGVSKLAQEMAFAAYNDLQYRSSMLSQNAACVTYYQELAVRNGLQTLESGANFVSFVFADSEEAGAVAAFMEQNDVFVIRPQIAPLSRLIRVTLAPEMEREIFAEALNRFFLRG